MLPRKWAQPPCRNIERRAVSTPGVRSWKPSPPAVSFAGTKAADITKALSRGPSDSS